MCVRIGYFLRIVGAVIGGDFDEANVMATIERLRPTPAAGLGDVQSAA